MTEKRIRIRHRARNGRRRELPFARLCLTLLLLTAATMAGAIQPIDPAQHATTKLPRSIPAPQLSVQTELTATVSLSADMPQYPAAADFVRRNGGTWEMRWDRRADRPNLVQGSGVALIPGSGNTLTAASIGLAANQTVDLAVVESRLRGFIDANRDLLGVDGLEFRLDPANSTPYGDGTTHWFIDFAQYKNDVRVDRAHMFFRLSHGNIVQFGTELVAPVAIDTQPVSTRDVAFDLALRELDFPAGTLVQTRIEPGELVLVPVTPHGEDAYLTYTGAAGAGYAHQLAWRFVFRVNDDSATYQVLFDAHANRVIEAGNINEYVDATVSGGIYPTTNTDAEVVVPFPYTTVTNNGTRITDALGIYDYSGGAATVTLNGQYFRMSDQCGSISLSNSSDGNVNFGSSGGTDCTTPGFGGNGNTHASRSGFYHLTRINEKARAILPGNGWLQSKVTANMDINDVCNAYWDGASLNFFKSGAGCSNTGEIAAVFLHEWGHGLDQNTGGAANEMGTGEAVGDTFAFLETRDACIGPNFQPGVPCHNCTSCTGVRDMADFGVDGARTIASPATVTDDNGIDCDSHHGQGGVACPYTTPNGQVYRGPMGYEGHCESVIASSANWDLTQALVSQYGEDAGYQAMDRIWYGSLTPSKSAYRVASGGQCNPAAQVDGCASNNWYTVFLAADDDNGNLSDGTPNACRIWDAFDAHGIACGARPACTADTADFTLAVTSDDHRTVCAGLNSPVTYNLSVGAVGAFNNVVTLDATGAPAGTSVAIDPNAQPPSFLPDVIVNSPGPQLPVVGDYQLTIAGSAEASPGHSVTLDLSVRQTASTTTLSSPADGATGVAIPTTFTWQPAADAEIYNLRVYSDAAHQNLVVSADLTGTSYTTSALLAGTTYYWLAYSGGSCGGGSQAFSFTTAAAQHHVGGSVSGLAGSGLALRLNGANDLPIGANGTFQFPDPLAEGAHYAVSVGNQPHAPTQVCSVANGDGTIGTADVSNVSVACVTSTYTVGGNVNGLVGSGLVLTLNGSNNLPLGANGAFTFPGNLASGSAYAVAVAAQPANPTQTCTVSNGSGTIGSANVTNVSVTCTTNTYTVGGSVSGLAGSGLALSLNGSTTLPVNANGAFTFPTALASGTNYTVTVGAQPATPTQTCTVGNGSGTIGSANVTNVSVACTTNTYTVGGSVSGLAGSGLVLSLNGSTTLPVNANGAFTFPTALASGTNYTVTVGAQPANPTQTCTVGNGSGTIGSTNVTNVSVVCATNTYTVGGSVGGLEGAGLVLDLNGTTSLPVDADGAFTFPADLASGSTYAVSVGTQPANPTQVCTITNGDGTIDSANVTDVGVICRIDDTLFRNGFDN